MSGMVSMKSRIKVECSYLRETEEDMNSHGGAENSEEDVRLPLDVFKGRRHEVREREVEDPVAGRSDGDSLATETQREQLWRVNPADGTPGWSK